MDSIVAVLFNLAFWLCMFGLQSWEEKRGRIPHRRPHNKARSQEGFLYIQDYHTTFWGDLLALSLIDAAMGPEIRQGILFWPALTALVITAYLHFLAWPSPTHKPDWAYPKTGKSSYGGKFHAIYFFSQLTLVLTGAWLLAARELSLLQQLMFGLGGISYLFTILLDVKSKRWAKIPPKQTTQKDYPFG